MKNSKRERKLDITKLPPEQVDVISKQIGEKVRQICDKACEEANRLLGVYGMSAKMQIVVEHPDLKKENSDSSDNKDLPEVSQSLV